MEQVLIIAGIYGAWWLFMHWIGLGGYERADRAGMAVGIAVWSVGALVALFLIAGLIWG